MPVVDHEASPTVNDCGNYNIDPLLPPPPLEPSKFVCPVCERRFSRRFNLRSHERSHTGEKPFLCRVSGCGQMFVQQSDRTRHEHTQHHGKSFMCGDRVDGRLSWGCGRSFRRKDGLLEHHRKTEKGKDCLAQRAKVMASEQAGDGGTLVL